MENEVNISEIIKALQIIKAECSKHSNCANCPFYTDDMCKIKYCDPEKWELQSNYVWRAFK